MFSDVLILFGHTCSERTCFQMLWPGAAISFLWHPTKRRWKFYPFRAKFHFCDKVWAEKSLQRVRNLFATCWRPAQNVVSDVVSRNFWAR